MYYDGDQNQTGLAYDPLGRSFEDFVLPLNSTGSYNSTFSVYNPAPVQTALIPDIYMNYNESYNITFAVNNYFEGADSIILQITNPDSGQLENISLANPIDENTAFLIDLGGNSTDLNILINSNSINYSNIITPFACNSQGCISGNQFNLTIYQNIISSSAPSSSGLVATADWFLGIFPPASSMTSLETIAISLICILLASGALILSWLFAGADFTPVFWAIVGIIDAGLIIMFTAINYIPFWIWIIIVAIFALVATATRKGSENK
jgi:hypothetical protein